jgi:predicted DNA-binding transcriptional regulator AlpA
MPKPTPLPDLITREQLAAKLGLRPKTLANWANSKKVKGPRPYRLEGGYAVYDTREVADWLERQGVRV